MNIKVCDVCGDQISKHLVMDYQCISFDISTHGLSVNGDICKTCRKVEKENGILDSLFLLFKERIEAIRKD